MSSPPDTRLAPLLARSLWIAIGPMALAATVAAIITSGAGWTTVADLMYFIILAAMLWGRWFEFRSGDAKDAYGKPATKEDLRRFMRLTPIFWFLLWAAANVVGNYLLPH
ncbi:MAG: hypothetical protein ACYC35_21505 [Pirellulales bacterium]